MTASGEEITVEDLLAESTAREATARVLLRQDLLAQHAELEARLEAVCRAEEMENVESSAPAIAAQIVALQDEIEAARRVFVFRSIGRHRWRSLIGEHPPTKDQKQQFGSMVDHNPLTFPAVAIAESCISPKMTVEHVRKFEAMIDDREWNRLWSACLDANLGGDAPKSVTAGRILRVNEQLGRTAAATGFPDLSSLDG